MDDAAPLPPIRPGQAVLKRLRHVHDIAGRTDVVRGVQWWVIVAPEDVDGFVARWR